MKYEIAILIILEHDAFDLLYPEKDMLDYYNYLADVYRRIESYKANYINYIENVVNKKDLEEYLTEHNYTLDDVRQDLQLLHLINKDDLKSPKSYPKVPDHLLKAKEHFVLPLRILHKKSDKTLLFNNIVLPKSILKEISFVINSCFYDQSADRLRENLMIGQEFIINNHFTTANTFLKNKTSIQLANKFKVNTPLQFEDNPYDNLFVTPDGLFFSIKILHIYFEGSFFEYRNFINQNMQCISYIAGIIEEYLQRKYDEDILVQFFIDRFIIDYYIESVINDYFQVGNNIALFKDTDVKNYDIPLYLEDIHFEEYLLKNDHIPISYFAIQSSIHNTKKVKVNVPKIETVDLKKLKEIHDKKFPGKPFLHTDPKS